MPRYFPNSRINDCWGSAGDVTFYHRDGVCYYRQKPVMEFAGTAGQMEHVGIHQRALEARRGLDHAVQLEWNRMSLLLPFLRIDDFFNNLPLFISKVG